MITADVAFCGESIKRGGDGLLRHRYLVVAQSPWEAVPTRGSAQATVISVNMAPMPRRPLPPRYVVLDGGERAAFDLAIADLKRLPGNRDMDLFVFEDPNASGDVGRPRGHSFG